MKKLKIILYTITGLATAVITALLIFTAAGGFDTAELSDYFIRRVRSPVTNIHTAVFDMDYRVFLTDNTVFNNDIALTSLLVSSHPSTTSFMGNLGLRNIETIYAGESADTDQAVLNIGHRHIAYGDTVFAVVLAHISGADWHNGWFSYFDVGADTEEYFAFLGIESHPDFLNHHNHKGYDVAANRIIALIRDYVDSLNTEGDLVLWLTGFGRSGAVANIAGAYFERDPDLRTFTYAFATPNVSTNPAVREYQTIFNIINEDDIVPLFPPAQWGFTRFGRDITVSLAGNEEAGGLFTQLTRARYMYNSNKSAVIDGILDIIPTREQVYVFLDGAYFVSESFQNRAEAEHLKDRLETVLEPGFERAGIGHLTWFSIYDPVGGEGYRLVQYQSNAFFLKVLGEIAAGGHVYRRNVPELFVPARASFDAAFTAPNRRPHSFAAHYVILSALAQQGEDGS